MEENRPIELDLNQMTDLGTKIARDGLGDLVVAALKAELVECDCETDDSEQAFTALKRAALPAFIALIEHSDPAEARKIFSELLKVYKEDIEVDRGDDAFAFKMDEDEINQSSEEIAKSGRLQLSELTAEHEDNSKRDDYIELMGDFLYAYSKINEGYLRDRTSIVGDLHGLLDHFVWKGD